MTMPQDEVVVKTEEQPMQVDLPSQNGGHDESSQAQMIKDEILKAVKAILDELKSQQTAASKENQVADTVAPIEQVSVKIEAALERTEVVKSSQAEVVKTCILQRYKYVKSEPLDDSDTKYKSIILDPSSAEIQPKVEAEIQPKVEAEIQPKVEAFAPPDVFYDRKLRNNKSY